MIKVYQENKNACDHIGCCLDADYAVERADNGAFMGVCAEHGTVHGSRTWSSDFNTVEFTNVQASKTVLGTDVPTPFFSEKAIELNII